MYPDQTFVEYVLRSLAENPKEVRVERTTDEMGVLLTVSLHRDDMGKVIGRAGATAKAIRTILRTVGMKHGARVNMKILEPEGRSYAAPSRIAGSEIVDELKTT